MTISLVADPSGTSGKIQVGGVDVATFNQDGTVDVPKGISGTPAFSARGTTTSVASGVRGITHANYPA